MGFALAAQPVPESIHSDSDGTAAVCGLTAPSVAALETEIQLRGDVERLQGTTYYTAYAIDERRVLTFTTAENRAHPAVACRQIFATPDGGSSIRTSISCNNSRENCDWLYREFEGLTNRTLQS
ncbi:MAG: hypothetical protein ABL874_02285, partial [Sphingopyxis sp.]